MFMCFIYDREFLGQSEDEVLELIEEYESLTFGRVMDSDLYIWEVAD